MTKLTIRLTVPQAKALLAVANGVLDDYENKLDVDVSRAALLRAATAIAHELPDDTADACEH